MKGRNNGPRVECLVIDLDTQHDFLDENGAYPVLNREELVPNVKQIMQWCVQHQVPIVSGIESHRRAELFSDAGPVRCVDGTRGQKKVPYTVLPGHLLIECDNTLSIPLDLLQKHQQLVFRKRRDDLLGNPKADRLLTQINAERLVLLGAGLEGAIKTLALGLIARHKNVYLVSDASGFWDKGKAELALRQVNAKGASLMTASELMTHTLLPRRTRVSIPFWLVESSGNGQQQNGRNGTRNGAGKLNGNGHQSQRTPLPKPRLGSSDDPKQEIRRP